MKKTILAIALALAASFAFSVDQQVPSSEASNSDDVVVLLDESQSVLPYFQDVTDYVLSSVVRDFLRFGDTFHLLTFGDSAQVEIAQRMNDERDVKSALGRLYLLYPLARHSDFLGALGYLQQYLSDLPENTRKVVIVITDGVQNPPPGSHSASMDKAATSAEIESICSAIRARGWDLKLIRLPFVPAGSTPSATAAGQGKPGAGAASTASSSAGASSGTQAAEAAGTSFFDIAAKALGAPVSDFSAEGKEGLARKSLSLPSVQFPPSLGKKGYDFSFPLRVENGSDESVGLELEGLLLGEEDILAKKSFLKLSGAKSGVMDVAVALPDSLEPGDKSLDVELRFANGIRVSPQSGKLEFTLWRAPFASFFRSSARIVLFAILLALGLAIVLGIVLILRRMPRRAEEPVVAAVLDSVSERKTVSASSSIAVTAPAKIPAKEISRTLATTQDSVAASVPARVAPRQAASDAASSTKAVAEYGSLKDANLSPEAAHEKPVLPAAAVHVPDEHEAAIAREAAKMADASKAESSHAADVLAEAAARSGPTAARERIAAFEARRESMKKALAARKKTAATKSAASSETQAGPGNSVVRPGTIRVELKVEDQNPNIGTRNVCTIHAGQAKSVGGPGSDFFVFLVPTARHAAELRFDGERLTLVPRKPELFPGVEGPIEDCLGQDILMLGKGGYPLILHFEVYERPADKINKLLHCIETPGLVSEADL